MSCDVMWCHVMSFDVMGFFCVVSCHVLQRDVLSCDEMSPDVKWCYAMGWDVMSLWCDMVGCEVMLCYSKGLRDVVDWNYGERMSRYYGPVLQSITPKNYSVLQTVLQSNTKFCKVLRTPKYYKVLQSASPYYKVLFRTTPYFKVLLRTAKYYSLLQSNTKYKVLQSTTKDFSLTTK